MPRSQTAPRLRSPAAGYPFDHQNTIQTDALNKAGHPTTIVVPGTSQVDSLPLGDNFPLRVRIQKTADLKYDTDLLIEQARTPIGRAYRGSFNATRVNILKPGLPDVARARASQSPPLSPRRMRPILNRRVAVSRAWGRR